jgi:hypothetical protein
MDVAAALGIFLFGLGIGGLLVWVEQTAARKQFRDKLETQLNEAFFGRVQRGHRSYDYSSVSSVQAEFTEPPITGNYSPNSTTPT